MRFCKAIRAAWVKITLPTRCFIRNSPGPAAAVFPEPGPELEQALVLLPGLGPATAPLPVVLPEPASAVLPDRLWAVCSMRTTGSAGSQATGRVSARCVSGTS